MRRALLIVMVLGALLLSACSDDGHHGTYPAPEQPDPAIADGVESALVALPGVESVDVLNEVECIDRCKGTRPNYAAAVTVSDIASGAEIAAIVDAHHGAYVAAGLPPTEESVRVERADSVFLDVAHPATTITPELASGFVLAADAGYPVRVDVQESIRMSVKIEHVDSCSAVDALVQPIHAVLAQASATAGIPFATISASCGQWASMSVPVVAGGVFVPGWGAASESINGLSLATDRPDGTIQDLFVYVIDGGQGIVRVSVEVNSGFELTDDELDVLNTLVADIQSLGAPGVELKINQF